MDADESLQTTRRPAKLNGVLAIAALAGVLSLYAGGRLAAGAADTSGGAASQVLGMGWPSGTPFGLPLAGLAILIGVLNLAFIWAAWTRRPWAWPVGLIANGLGVLGLAVLVLLGLQTPNNAFAHGFFYTVVLGYLLTPPMRRALTNPGPA